MPASKPFSSPRLVLDTNVVLDWLLFSDARAGPVAEAIQNRSARWVGCLLMRRELVRTLRKPTLAKKCSDSERILASFDLYCELAPDPSVSAGQALHCTDPNDQLFIDFALERRANWLLTYDKALLRLARRSQRHGVAIAPPQLFLSGTPQGPCA
jgi:predicted nucleic acid-binding protein